MAKGRFWTEDELERLRQLARTGQHTRLELADMMGRSQSSTDEKLQAFNIKPKPIKRSSVYIGGREWLDQYQVPERIKTDHLKHCLAVIRSNGGNGFPAGFSTAKGDCGGKVMLGAHVSVLMRHEPLDNAING